MITILSGTALAVSLLAPTASAGHIEAAAVDYNTTTKCLYSTTDPGWASVGRAPRGTTSVIFTMRTGEPGAWNAAEIEGFSKARQWRTTTGTGMSFINWVTFYGDEGYISTAMVNTRCEGTPTEWPE